MTTRARLIAALALLPVFALTACGGSSGPDGAGKKLDVVTSFYPLAYATQQIAGDLADVTDLTKPGAEPHDLELTPGEVGQVSDADLVVYLKTFQPSVDQAVTTEAADRSLDVSEAANLNRPAPAEDGEPAVAGASDPHFWLDPTRLDGVAAAITDRLATLDPEHAGTFQANAKALGTKLVALDGEFEAGLATCANTNIVTSHEAFGYLAQRYGLRQVGIAGLSPEADPDAATLARVTDFVRADKVGTIYYETLISPKIAETVAAETGARTAVLDPIEGLTASSAGDDYLSVMRANLTALRAGQDCT